jgi:hypothetical protein
MEDNLKNKIKNGRQPQKNENDFKTRKLIFGMQPNFDQTRKTTSKKMEYDLKNR